MGALPAEDLKDIDKPLSYREMFKKILDMIEQDREDRAEDRELLEKFISTQSEFNQKMEARVGSLEVCNGTQDEAIGTLKKRVDGWNALNSLGVIIASILAAIGLKGS